MIGLRRLNEAKSYLVLQEFAKCLEECRDGLLECNVSNNLSSEAKRIKEGLCMISIQAYAELNQWQLVVPFVKEQYSDFYHLPRKLILVCASLFIMINNFELAQIMIEDWLNYSDNKDNLSDYQTVVDNYIINVLMPTRQFRKLRQFIKDNEAFLDRNRVEGYVETAKRAISESETTDCKYEDFRDDAPINDEIVNYPSTGKFRDFLRIFRGSSMLLWKCLSNIGSTSMTSKVLWLLVVAFFVRTRYTGWSFTNSLLIELLQKILYSIYHIFRK
ncbi:Peroxisome assembly protein 26 [Trichoplax sp. H2]|nr:Peroxisome assembly protein 26 [Trichoplax sp. H2]|eukprot:RDD47140.1 Peroxisome assembly protein 26 [Trichoplax sp. H2]